MKSTINESRWVPSSYNGHYDVPEGKVEVFYTVVPTNGRYYAIAYVGKGAKPAWHCPFTSVEKMEASIARYIESCKEVVRTKAESRAKRAEQNASVTVSVGDIFVNSWGYDQTNVDYYQVVEVKGRTATLVEIDSESVAGSDGFMSCRVKPVKDSFRGVRFNKRIQGYNGEAHFSFNYGGCSKVKEGDTHYCSWYA